MTRCDLHERGDLDLFFYGELEGDARAAVAAHVQSCRDCRAALDDLHVIRDVLASRPDVSSPPAGDWSGFMSRLGTSIEQERRGAEVRSGPAAVPFTRRPIAAYVAMAATFALVTASVGYVVAHRPTSVTVSPAPSSPGPVSASAEPGEVTTSTATRAAVTAASQTVVADAGENAAFAAVSEQHFERSKLVVLGLATKDPKSVSASDWAYERQLASSLLSDTQLYKRAAEDRGLTSLAKVMSDLEIVLLQTSLSDDRDSASLERIQRLIRRRDLVTKMDVIETGTQGF